MNENNSDIISYQNWSYSVSKLMHPGRDVNEPFDVHCNT